MCSFDVHVQMWKKFGDAENDRGKGPNGDGTDPATTLIADEVFLTLTTNKEVATYCCHGETFYHVEQNMAG